jgi:hypothetical protein
MLHPELDSAISAKVVEMRPAHRRKMLQREREAREAESGKQ